MKLCSEARAADLLVSLSARFRLNTEQEEQLRCLISPGERVAWEEAEDEAIYRRTGGLLCHHLRRAGLEPPVGLRKAYAETANATMVFEAELRRIAGPLQRAGVQVLLIKGTALHYSVYENPGLRPFEDSDWVLASGEDAQKAGRILRGFGYETEGNSDFSRWIRGPFSIEFHRNFLGDARIESRVPFPKEGDEKSPNAQVRERARPSPFGAPYLIPAPEDHLIILATHLMKHNFDPGIWFTDLEALLTTEPKFDWDAAISRAESWGLIRPLAFAFRNIGALGACGMVPETSGLVPEHAKNVLKAIPLTFLDRALLNLAGKGVQLSGEKDEWEHAPIANLIWLSSINGFAAKIGLLWEAAFPRGEVMVEIYPNYRPVLRWWFILRRAIELARLGCVVISRMWMVERGARERG